MAPVLAGAWAESGAIRPRRRVAHGAAACALAALSCGLRGGGFSLPAPQFNERRSRYEDEGYEEEREQPAPEFNWQRGGLYEGPEEWEASETAEEEDGGHRPKPARQVVSRYEKKEDDGHKKPRHRPMIRTKGGRGYWFDEIKEGQWVSGKAMGRNDGGVYLDIGVDLDAFLPVSEMGEGFPENAVEEIFIKKRGLLMARVLSMGQVEGTPMVLTKRQLDADRPEFEENWNWRVMEGESNKQWMNGTIIGMTFTHLRVNVPSPDGHFVTARLWTEDFGANFSSQEARLGSTVKVRIKTHQNHEGLSLTMLGRDLGTSMFKPRHCRQKVGEEVTGTVVDEVRRGRFEKLLGYTVDVGARKLAFIETVEFHDGFPRKNILNFGDTRTFRVLKIEGEGDRVYLTRRSGDLYRPYVPELENDVEVDGYTSLKKSGEFVEGEVVRMLPPGLIFVQIQPEGLPRAVGFMNVYHTKPKSFEWTVYPGQKVKVRVKEVLAYRKRIMLTMFDTEQVWEQKKKNWEQKKPKKQWLLRKRLWRLNKREQWESAEEEEPADVEAPVLAEVDDH